MLIHWLEPPFCFQVIPTLWATLPRAHNYYYYPSNSSFVFYWAYMLSCITCCLYFDVKLCLNFISWFSKWALYFIFISFSKLLSVSLHCSGIKMFPLCPYASTGPDKAGVNVIGVRKSIFQLYTLVCHKMQLTTSFNYPYISGMHASWHK